VYVLYDTCHSNYKGIAVDKITDEIVMQINTFNEIMYVRTVFESLKIKLICNKTKNAKSNDKTICFDRINYKDRLDV
jgi:hypothetical protein